MKKSILSTVLILLLFSSCTVQKTVDPNIFIARLEENSDFSADRNTMHYDETVCALFLDYKLQLRMATEMEMNENGTVSSIAVSSKSGKSDLFLEAVKEIVKTYSPDEDIGILNENLFTDKYTYFESDSYLYSGYKDNDTVFFSVINKNLAPPEAPELTLRAETAAKN